MQDLYTNLDTYLNSINVHESKRFADCPWCGKGTQHNHFVVTRKPNYFLCYCHRCRRTKRLNTQQISYSHVQRLRYSRNETNNSEDITRHDVKLPFDFSTEIPKDGLSWLEQYNITDEERVQYNMGYSPSFNRLILPVYSAEGRLVYYQGRKLGSLKKGEPKYLNVKTSGSKQYFHIHKDSKLIVVVEDILSAIAVSRTGVSAISILGVHLPDNLTILEQYDEVVIWLDPDMKVLSQQHAKRLRSLGKHSKAIVSHNKDPKYYTTEELKQFLKLGGN